MSEKVVTITTICTRVATEGGQMYRHRVSGTEEHEDENEEDDAIAPAASAAGAGGGGKKRPEDS